MTTRLGPLAECRSCSCPIRFVRLDSGKAMPVNPLPNASNGNVSAYLIGGRLHGHVISATKPPERNALRFVAHYATCEERPRSSDPNPKPDSDPVLF